MRQEPPKLLYSNTRINQCIRVSVYIGKLDKTLQSTYGILSTLSDHWSESSILWPQWWTPGDVITSGYEPASRWVIKVSNTRRHQSWYFLAIDARGAILAPSINSNAQAGKQEVLKRNSSQLKNSQTALLCSWEAHTGRNGICKNSGWYSRSTQSESMSKICTFGEIVDKFYSCEFIQSQFTEHEKNIYKSMFVQDGVCLIKTRARIEVKADWSYSWDWGICVWLNHKVISTSTEGGSSSCQVELMHSSASNHSWVIKH